MALPVNRVLQMESTGPAGMPMFCIITEREGERLLWHRVCQNCFLCGVNGSLAFRPQIFEATNFDGYVVPTSRPVIVQAHGEAKPMPHLLPTPFCAMIVPFDHHPRSASVGVPAPNKGDFDLGVPNNWMGQVQQLLRLVPDLKPGQPFSLHQQFGAESGARRQGWEMNSDARLYAPHGFTRVTYGRNRLNELDSRMSREWLIDALTAHPPATAGFGLDMILHLSRVAAGSLPDGDQELWNIWERFAGEPDDIQQYHRAVLALQG